MGNQNRWFYDEFTDNYFLGNELLGRWYEHNSDGFMVLVYWDVVLQAYKGMYSVNQNVWYYTNKFWNLIECQKYCEIEITKLLKNRHLI